MQLTKHLNDFNLELAKELRPTFPETVEPVQGDDEALRFRGPIGVGEDPAHIGTHVTIALNPEVRAALAEADGQRRIEITRTLVLALASQVRATYDSNKVGQFALPFTGHMGLLSG